MENTSATPETLRVEYSEVCKSHGAITEFRAMLLALLPLASGTGIFLLLSEKPVPLDKTYLGPIGLFGLVVTLGLFFHELRGIQHCNHLIDRAKKIERLLGLTDGQFTSDKPAHLKDVVGATGAAWLIYPATLLAWLYVTGIGFKWWC
jgi:hypothetical protein